MEPESLPQGALGQMALLSVSMSSSIKRGDESYPGDRLGKLKELLGRSRCSITTTTRSTFLGPANTPTGLPYPSLHPCPQRDGGPEGPGRGPETWRHSWCQGQGLISGEGLQPALQEPTLPPTASTNLFRMPSPSSGLPPPQGTRAQPQPCLSVLRWLWAK